MSDIDTLRRHIEEQRPWVEGCWVHESGVLARMEYDPDLSGVAKSIQWMSGFAMLELTTARMLEWLMSRNPPSVAFVWRSVDGGLFHVSQGDTIEREASLFSALASACEAAHDPPPPTEKIR